MMAGAFSLASLKTSEPILVPLTKKAAASLIWTMYNEYQDPMTKIIPLLDNQSSSFNEELGRIMISYYLSCIKYLTDLDFKPYLSKENNIGGFIMDEAIFDPDQNLNYKKLKDDGEVKPQLIGFHALFGAYVMCRPVQNKVKFRDWVSKRYASFMYSLQLTPDSYVHLDLQESGARVNAIMSGRPFLRRAIYDLVKLEKEGLAGAVITHVRFLVAFTDMTTYSMIQSVIAKAGPILALQPFLSLYVKYHEELEKVKEKLTADGHSETEIQYLKLIYPTSQQFKSADYADFVAAAELIQEIENPGDKSIQSYKYKSTSNINRSFFKQFLRFQSKQQGLSISEVSRRALITILGESANELYSRAEATIKAMKSQ